MLSKKAVLGLVVVAGLSFAAIADAQVTVFSDDFESYGVQNPASDPLGPWTYVGPGGANSSRTFQPGDGAGADTMSIGWITNVDGSGIQASIPLSSLAGTALEDGAGNLLGTNVYTLSFMHAVETSNTTRSNDFEYDLTTSASLASLNFVAGGNGDASQSLSSLNDGGFNIGGSVGKTPERQWSVEFTAADLTTGDSLDLLLSRVGPTAGAMGGFTYFDDVQLTAAVPEPSSLGLLGLSLVGLLAVRRRR